LGRTTDPGRGSSRTYEVAQEIVERRRDRLARADARLPPEQLLRVGDARLAELHVLVAVAVVARALHHAEACERREPIAQRVSFERLHEQFGEAADAEIVVGIADVEDAAVADRPLVDEDADAGSRCRRADR
jgi:hypothetical protein